VFVQTTKRRSLERDFVRFRLAEGLLLAFHLVVGSDILTTILDPSAEELLRLSVIIAIR
jgi:uncharacterized membrane protein